MRTLWVLVVGAKAGLTLLWRARRSGRTFQEQLDHETWQTKRRSLPPRDES